jgi:hypothetical protein
MSAAASVFAGVRAVYPLALIGSFARKSVLKT